MLGRLGKPLDKSKYEHTGACAQSRDTLLSALLFGVFVNFLI